ncbi:hypothetical protein [Xylella fastidiosa]|uniref:hypothetical protein n=1 Tax=Xylella fastidiosa TaxID=2371 RepID=UPI000707A584|nr:hypothetical protein [Xylella fastidiosa]KQH74378.1 hypothetical protein AOT81_04140 [Xylella fastidiosa]WNY18621.1 hypothetical protein RO839_09055 [Xylella fastidiosa]WNY20908.1 hypothetical protein RO838_09070 [Xylella fastidiosa]
MPRPKPSFFTPKSHPLHSLIERTRLAVRDWLTAPSLQERGFTKDLSTLQAQFHSGQLEKAERFSFFVHLKTHGITPLRRCVPGEPYGYTCTCGAIDGNACTCLELRREVRAWGEFC